MHITLLTEATEMSGYYHMLHSDENTGLTWLGHLFKQG